MVIDIEKDYRDNLNDGCLTVKIPDKMYRLEDGEPQCISGDEFDAPLLSSVKPHGWKDAKKKRKKAAKKARRINRR